MSEPTPQPRRKPPLSIQVQVLARMLGLDLSKIEWHHQHERALGGPDTADNYVALSKPDHDKITNGPGGERRITSAGSSKHKIAHADRLSKDNAAFNARMAQGLARHERQEASRWPSQKIKSRPFQSKGKRNGR